MNASSVHLRFEVIIVTRSGRCAYYIIYRMCCDLCERARNEKRANQRDIQSGGSELMSISLMTRKFAELVRKRRVKEGSSSNGLSALGRVELWAFRWSRSTRALMTLRLCRVLGVTPWSSVE